MIVDKVLKVSDLFPEKDAIIFNGIALSYRELAMAIRRRSNESGSENATFIFNDNPVETIVQVLAKNLSNEPVLVMPYDFPESRVSEIRDQDIPEKSFIGILTSGSTGKSKGVWKTNDNWEKAFEYQSSVFGISASDKVFVLDALSYSANLNAALHILWLGGTLVLGQLKCAKKWRNQFLNEGVTSCFLVPSHCRLLVKDSGANNGIKSIVTAGEKLNSTTALELVDIFPNAKLTEYYGAAELGHITYHQGSDIYNYPHSVGKPFPQVKVSVKDEKVTVESPYVSGEYKNKGTVDDLGYFDEGDRLILKGRAGRMFNRRALNIYAQEIENIALSFSSVERAVLVEDEINRRLSLYFTTNKFALGNNEEELTAFLRECLPSSKVPNFVKELDEIPHSEAGKVDFRALSKMCSEERNRDVVS